MCVNNLSEVALDSAAAGIEPATSSRKSSALTTTPPFVCVILTGGVSDASASTGIVRRCSSSCKIITESFEIT